MINPIQKYCSTESITAFIDAPDALTPAVYSIIEWWMPKDGFGGSITLEGSRSFKNFEVSQIINFEGLSRRHFRRFSVKHIAGSRKPVTIEATDRNTFQLSADGCVFFEGKALASSTNNRPNVLFTGSLGKLS